MLAVPSLYYDFFRRGNFLFPPFLGHGLRIGSLQDMGGSLVQDLDLHWFTGFVSDPYPLAERSERCQQGVLTRLRLPYTTDWGYAWQKIPQASQPKYNPVIVRSGTVLMLTSDFRATINWMWWTYMKAGLHVLIQYSWTVVTRDIDIFVF